MLTFFYIMWVTNEFYLHYLLTSKVINDHHERFFGIIRQADGKGASFKEELLNEQPLEGNHEVNIGWAEVFEQWWWNLSKCGCAVYNKV